MRPDPKASFAAGLLALMLFIGGGIAFALDPDMLSGRITWIARFDSVAALADGAPVTAYGLAIGRVGRRTWMPATKDYEVELRMNPDWQPPIGGAMRIEQANPLQSAVVAQVDSACPGLRAPTGRGPREVATCDHVPGLFEVSSALLARMGAITEQVQALVGAATSGTDQAAQGSRFELVADNLTAMSASLRALVDQLAALQPELRGTLESAHTLTADADATLQSVRRDTLARLNRTLDGADQLVRVNAAPLQASLGDVRYILGASSNSVVRLMTQTDLLTANLAELTRQLRDNPASLVRGRSLEDPTASRAARP